jgi:hypothetical protein
MCFLLHILYVGKYHSLLAVFFQSYPSASRSLWRGNAAAHLLGLQVRIRRGHGYLSLVTVVCCVSTDSCDWPIPPPGESYRERERKRGRESVCVCDCECASLLETMIVITLYTYSE